MTSHNEIESYYPFPFCATSSSTQQKKKKFFVTSLQRVDISTRFAKSFDPDSYSDEMRRNDFLIKD